MPWPPGAPVSIHSRRPGREKPPDAGVLSVADVSIHSRRPGREKHPHAVHPSGQPVSIHSRRPGREKRDAAGKRVGFHAVSIHSRRPGREKRWRITQKRSLKLFQSTPAVQDGRNYEVAHAKFPQWCFNPLPPSRTGETRLRHGGMGDGQPCFNPLPPSRTGETAYFPVNSLRLYVVSIHSRRPGREKRRYLPL